MRERVPPRVARLAVAVGVALLTAAWVYWGSVHRPEFRSDFDQLLFAARAILGGQDPYQLIGPGRAFDQPWPLYYPPAATLVALPFSSLPTVMARAGYAFCVSLCLTYLLLKSGYSRLPALMSGAYLQAMSLLQWSPLLTCALLMPAWGWVIAVKPNVGLAVGAAAQDRRALVTFAAGSVAAMALSFAMVPGWFGEWRDALRSAGHVRPFVSRPGGALLLLGLLRWRRPEARFLAALAVVPTTFGPADALILFAFPHSLRQGLSLALLTHAAYFYAVTRPPGAEFADVIATSAGATLVFVLLPALGVVLTRPNVGAAPGWLERWVRGFPPFLRGAGP